MPEFKKFLEGRKPWFKRKRWGWGWTPISWEGWLLTLVYVGVMAGSVISIDAQSHSTSDTLIAFAIIFIPTTLILIAISYLRGEKK